MKLLLIAAAGGAGTLARYALSLAVQRSAPGVFPWGTLAVNVAGCLLFGVVWALAEDRMAIGGETRAVLLIGFMGAFTTFSSFAFETAQLMRDGEWALAAANAAAQNLCGIAALVLGWWAGRAL